MTILLIIPALAALYLLMIAPNAGRGRASKWKGMAFAHRGLHNSDISENTIAAFEHACINGFGIELDVQLSRDGVPVVFHDDDLLRMTGDERRVEALDLNEIQALRFSDGSCIPTLEETLRCVNSRVPLLVEIKNGKRNAQLCRKVVDLLRGYKGPYILESFNPLILFWLRRNAPEIIRGQLVSEKENYMPDFGAVTASLLSGLFLNVLARPDFVAYDVSAAAYAAPRIQRRLFRTPLAAWTVTDEAAFDTLIGRGEMPIFEGFHPKKY